MDIMVHLILFVIHTVQNDESTKLYKDLVLSSQN